MTAKPFINIVLLLIILVTSLPFKKAGQYFLKKQVQQERCDAGDTPLKNADDSDSTDFKEYTCCHYPPPDLHTAGTGSGSLQVQLGRADWQLPLWPAVDIHTPPPNRA